jgi:hypothetical protein
MSSASEAKPLNYYESEYAEYWIEDEILIEVLKPHIKVITLKIAIKTIEDRKLVHGNKLMPVYLDINNVNYFDLDARKYTALPETYEYISATGILVRDYLQYVGTKLFLTLFPPKNPTQVFKIKSKAIKWLKTYQVK